MTSRAVHLELVHSLSADSAIMSLRRFIARRGAPDTLFSDNGTCFVGADRMLREFYQADVNDFAASRGIKWSFIPPAAPFFGGCWERLVRTVKVALNATLRERAPNTEVLVTLLLEAEAIVNSRPLSHVPVRHDDQETLTPFHFLIGSSSNQVLPATLEDRDLLRRADWKKALRLADHFWNRWVKEILPNMQPRQTSENRERDLRIGDLVLIVDANLPRGTWPRGRVTATFPGQDGIVRVVDVATQGGLLRRPSKKLVRLDV
jgi:transposase InsO family protein